MFSGHAVYMQQIMELLIARGHRVTVICRNPGGLPEVDEHRGIRIIRLESTDLCKRGTLAIARALVRERSSFDTLHINGFPDPYGILLSMCRFLDKRIVLQSTLYGSDDGYAYCRNHRGGSLRVKQLALVDAVTVISRPLMRTFEEIGFPKRKLVYIPQGVDLERFKPVQVDEKQATRERLGIPVDAQVALFVGTVLKRKGIDWLIDAWRIVQAELLEAQLIVVGMYEFDETHKSRVELNEFAEAMKDRVHDGCLNVKFVGLKEHVEEWYQAADVLVLPSRKEGFGNVIIEGMACGLPAVVTPMDGVASETVVDGANGFIVEGVEALAYRIRELLRDLTRTAELGARARTIVESRFNMSVIADSYEIFYFSDVL